MYGDTLASQMKRNRNGIAMPTHEHFTWNSAALLSQVIEHCLCLGVRLLHRSEHVQELVCLQVFHLHP